MRNYVKKCRKALGLTQDELARLAGVAHSTVSAIETGKYVPCIDTALKLAAVLDTDVNRLFVLDTCETSKILLCEERYI